MKGLEKVIYDLSKEKPNLNKIIVLETESKNSMATLVQSGNLLGLLKPVSLGAGHTDKNDRDIAKIF